MSRATRLTPLVWLLGLGACTSILGIDDLHEGRRPGSGGEATTGATSNSNAGESNVSGKANAAGTSNSAGGVNGNDAGAGPGGEGGTGQVVTPGGADQGGAPNPDGTTVRGHVIDF